MADDAPPLPIQAGKCSIPSEQQCFSALDSSIASLGSSEAIGQPGASNLSEALEQPHESLLTYAFKSESAPKNLSGDSLQSAQDSERLAEQDAAPDIEKTGDAETCSEQALTAGETSEGNSGMTGSTPAQDVAPDMDKSRDTEACVENDVLAGETSEGISGTTSSTPAQETSDAASAEMPETVEIADEVVADETDEIIEELDLTKSHQAARIQQSLRDDIDRSTALFSGCWGGTRNNFKGEVGINFVAKTCCVVNALGRHVGSKLSESRTVTLWSSEHQAALASVDIGPASLVEENFAYEELKSPVCLEPGQEYRLSQTCEEEMEDKWFDGVISTEERQNSSASRYALFVGGVCSNARGGYPHRKDGERRRAGMVTCKFARQCLDIQPVSREELAQALACIVAAEEPDDVEASQTYMLVVATVLSLLVDELAESEDVAAFVAIACEEDLDRCVSIEPLDWSGVDAGELPCSVFDPSFASAMISFSSKYRSRSDAYGGPMNGAFVVSHRTGKVLACGARLRKHSDVDQTSREVTGPAMLASLLERGATFARSPGGTVTAFVVAAMREGQALAVHPHGCAVEEEKIVETPFLRPELLEEPECRISPRTPEAEEAQASPIFGDKKFSCSSTTLALRRPMFEPELWCGCQ